MSEISKYFASEDYEGARLVVDDVAALNDEMRDQNNRLDEANAVFADDPEMLSVLIQAIADEQQTTTWLLHEIDHESERIYTQLGSLILSTDHDQRKWDQRVVDAQSACEAKETEAEAVAAEERERELSRFEELLEKALRLAPDSPNTVRAEFERRRQESTTSLAVRKLEEEVEHLRTEIDRAIHRADRHTQEMSQVNEFVGCAGTAWVLPRALMQLRELQERAEVSDGFVPRQFILDELPVDPNLGNAERNDTFARIYENYRRDQPEASFFIALYLVDHAGEAVSIEELGAFLYTDQVHREVGSLRIRRRVTSLLAPKRDHVDDLLLDAGYVLQYGWRHILEENREGVLSNKSRRRIYRAISIDDPGALDTNTFEGETYTDEFVVTPELRDLLPSADPTQAKANQTTNPAAVEAATTEESDSEWLGSFRNSVQDAIQSLEDWGLLHDADGVAVKVARRLSHSGIFATDTTLDFLLKAKLLSGFDPNDSQRFEHILSPRDLLIMRLFRSRDPRDPLRRGSRHRNQALGVVDEAIRNYYKAKQHQEKQ